MIIEGAEYIEGKDGEEGYWRTYVREVHVPEEGNRHSPICEVCGMSCYPECRKTCMHGRDD